MPLQIERDNVLLGVASNPAAVNFWLIGGDRITLEPNEALLFGAKTFHSACAAAAGCPIPFNEDGRVLLNKTFDEVLDELPVWQGRLIDDSIRGRR